MKTPTRIDDPETLCKIVLLSDLKERALIINSRIVLPENQKYGEIAKRMNSFPDSVARWYFRANNEYMSRRLPETEIYFPERKLALGVTYNGFHKKMFAGFKQERGPYLQEDKVWDDPVILSNVSETEFVRALFDLTSKDFYHQISEEAADELEKITNE